MSAPPPAGRRRPAVLGYRIEPVGTGERFRLTAEDAPAEVLHEGTLEQCRESLVARLTERFGHGRPNVAIPTLGGKQLWADVFWHADWRIQEHVFTGHCRLLDPRDVRRAHGTFETCRTAFERVRVDDDVQLPSPHVVVLLHGLGRTRGSMDKLAASLRAAGYSPAALDYPSTRRTIGEHADQVERVLDALEDAERVSFVTHSLGGIVTRAVLARDAAFRERLALGRVVMMAPPSTGADLAEALHQYSPFQALLGPPVDEIARREVRDVPAPPCDFGIIAGGRGDGRGWNPWLEGDDDGIVRVEEARLAGADDFLVVDSIHTFIMDQPEVVEAVVRFLDAGTFAPGPDADPG